MSKWLAVLVVACLAAVPAAAQEQRGSIEGIVKVSSGGLVPGATVEARSPSAVGVSTAVTDADGVFRFPALPPGTYTVTASLSGFAPARSNDIVLALGQVLKVTLHLGVASVAETVTVSG